MAITAQYGGGAGGGHGAVDSSTAAAGDSMGARMKRARRHSATVRVLRTALPISLAAILAVFSMSVMNKAGIGLGLPDIPVPRILPENLAMANPHYEGFGKDGSSYRVTAKTARQNFDNTNIINLDQISGVMVDLDKSKTNFTAVRGDYNQKSAMLELFEKITVDGDTGLKAVLKSATLNTKDNSMVSKEPVNIAFTAGTITANGMRLRNKIHEATFAGNVVAQFVPEKPKTPETVNVTAAEAAAAAANAVQMFSTSDSPLDVTSARLDVKDAINTAVFMGNVLAIQAGQSLRSPELTVVYARDSAANAGKKPQNTATPAGKIQHIAAKGPVVLERGVGDRVNANALEFDATTNIATLTGNVIMRSGVDRHATSDRADMNQTDGTILLTGAQVDVLQGLNELHGRRLFINRLNGTALLTSPPTAGAGPGRIKTKFYSGGADGNKKAKAAKPEAKPNDGDGSPMASFKSDPNKPMDIEAEQLDVNNPAKTATFRGDVVAIQGDITFKTAEMVAIYTGDVNLADATEPKIAGDKDKKSETELTRIEAKKNVTVTSKDGQSVQGDWATFDAKANTIVVGGEVILSKGGSMVRGSRMNIDLTTGENTMETTPGETVQLPGGGGWATSAPESGAATSNRGRPSAVFFPSDMGMADKNGKKKQSSKTKPAQASPASTPQTGEAWSTETAPADQGSNPLDALDSPNVETPN